MTASSWCCSPAWLLSRFSLILCDGIHSAVVGGCGKVKMKESYSCRSVVLSADKLIQEYKELVVSCLRHLELKQAGQDAAKVEQLKLSSDDDVLSRWLWKIVIVGGLLCFLVLPFVFAILGTIISILIVEILWTILRLAMGLVLILLIMAIYVTVNKSKDKE